MKGMEVNVNSTNGVWPYLQLICNRIHSVYSQEMGERGNRF